VTSSPTRPDCRHFDDSGKENIANFARRSFKDSENLGRRPFNPTLAVEGSEIGREGREVLLNILLNSCIQCKQVEKAIEIVEFLLRDTTNNFFHVDEVSFNTLIKGCAQAQMVHRAKQLFEKMRKLGLTPTYVTFNSLIDVFVRCNQMDEAWRYFSLMRSSGLKPDNFTVSTLVKGIKPSARQLSAGLRLGAKSSPLP